MHVNVYARINLFVPSSYLNRCGVRCGTIARRKSFQLDRAQDESALANTGLSNMSGNLLAEQQYLAESETQFNPRNSVGTELWR